MERSKQLLFNDLVAHVQQCKLCSRMQGRRKVLGLTNGNLDSPVVFVAEAPGRLGADKYGIPLYGDQTGRNFEELITKAGLSRESVFITNAILCNPRTSNGNNDSPMLTEIRNCSAFLKQTLEIIKPVYVVPLGTTALKALNVIEPHAINLSQDVGKTFKWYGYLLYPLYHPGPRAFVWRKKTEQSIDYVALSHLLKKGSSRWLM